MKKQLFFLFCGLALFFSLSAAMCETETLEPTPDPEPTLKDYTCKCTYVPTDTTQAIKEETQTVKAEDNFRAGMECDKLESKYYAQFFSGSCLIQ